MSVSKYLALFCLAIIFSACSFHTRVPVGTIPPVEPPSVSASKEAVQGLVGMAQSQGQKVSQKGPDYVRVKRIWDRLAKAADAKSGLWPVFVVDAGEDVNAAAVNGAAMQVYRELIHRVKDDAQLATILAHEMGHILAKHHENVEAQESNAATVGIGSEIIGAAVSIVGSTQGWSASGLAGDAASGVASTVGEGAIVQSFSRSQEYDADQIGLMVMAKAGYNPEAAITFWKNASEILGNYDGISFFATHPSHEDRLEALQEALPHALKYYDNRKPVKGRRVS